jgi:ABC-type transport system involved in multi-copper enzyme maturation permease subunit
VLPKTSKLNEVRLWGLLLILIGMGVMVLGTAGIVYWGSAGKAVASVFLILGMLCMLGSVVLYFWAGIMSTSAIQLECPECGKRTKMLGRTDRCMYCKTILTVDPEVAGIKQDGRDGESGGPGA